MEKSTADLEGISQQQQQPQPANQARPRRRATVSNSFIAVCLCLAIFVFFTRPRSLTGPYAPYFTAWTGGQSESPGHHHQQQEQQGTDDGKDTSITSTRVPFEAHIMSKCPDAQACLLGLVVPTMEQVHDKVDFRLSFIGNASSTSDRVSCMHGPGECIGNMLILCAANLPFPPSTSSSLSSAAGKTPPIRSLGFANCLISKYERIPSRTFVQNCAAEYGIDFGDLNRCVSRGLEMGSVDLDDNDDDDILDEDGYENETDEVEGDKPSGLHLLRKSFKRSKQVGASKSCTVRVDEKVWCIHDGGEWVECGDESRRSDVWTLVDEIERLWQERN